MHTLPDTLQQQTDAITQHLNASSERLKQHMERATQRFIVRMALFIGAINALFFAFYRFG
jgi:hypothetical protein